MPDRGESLAMRHVGIGLVLAGSALSWCLLFWVVPPSLQDFPLNDDWAFGRGAELFAQGKGIHYLNWASMPLLGQWLWSAPFLHLIGYNFFALRLSTIALSWLGLWAFYDLLLQEDVSPGRAALATAALAWNPLFLLLQGTYMSDVPALSFSLAALALYGRAMNPPRPGFMLAAMALGCLGVLTRQNAIAAPVAAGLAVWRYPRLWRNPLAILAVLVPIGLALYVHYCWFMQRSDVVGVPLRFPPPDTALLFPFLLLHFCGLTVLPLAALAPRPLSIKRFLGALAAMLVCARYWYVWAIVLAYGEPGLFPYRHNMISPWGAFSGTPDFFLVPGSENRPRILTDDVRLVLTLLGCVGGAWLLDRMLAWPGWRRPGLILMFTIVHLPLALAASMLHDRYLLVLLPGALWFAAVGPKKASSRWLAAFLVMLAIAAASLAFMHDWLSWNAARWQLGRRAEPKLGIKALDIEGGFEWDGWYSETAGQGIIAPPAPGLVIDALHDAFPKITGRCLLSFSPIVRTKYIVSQGREVLGAGTGWGIVEDRVADTAVLDKEPYHLWLKRGTHYFYLLRYQPPDRRSGTRQPSRSVEASQHP
jgi:hypothetical protein